MLPDVYFKKIEISDTLGGKSFSYDNPHVSEINDVEWAEGRTNNRYSQVSRQRNSMKEDSISISVDLDVDNDTATLDELNLIVNDEELSGYIKIYLIQVVDNTALVKAILSNLGSMSSDEIRKLGTSGYITVMEIPLQEIYSTKSFPVRSRNPQDIAYILYLDFDFNKLVSDHDLLVDYNDIAGMLPAPRVGVVFKNGSLASSATSFTDTEVIIDSRAAQTPIEIQHGGSDFDSMLKKKDYNEPEYEMKRKYFSKNYLTSDSDGGARGAFSFNIRDAVRHKSKFGWLIKDHYTSIETEVISLSTIKEIKIYRKRVQKKNGINSLNSLYESYVEIDGGIEDVRLLRLTEKNFKKMRTHLGVPFYTFSDLETASLSDGEYSYMVDISIEDGTIEFMNRKYDLLKSIAKKIEELYHESSYNQTRAGYFNESFKEFIYNFHVSHKISMQYFAVELIDIGSLFYDLSSKLFSVLKSYTDPSSGSHQGISDLMEFCNKLLNNFQEVLSSHSYSIGRVSMAGPSRNQNEIHIQEDLAGVFDSNLEKGGGVDYVEFIDSDGNVTPYTESIGLNVVSGLDYTERSAVEAAKLFREPSAIREYSIGANAVNISNVVENAYAFLTPTAIKTQFSSLYLQQATPAQIEAADTAISSYRSIPTMIEKSNNTSTVISSITGFRTPTEEPGVEEAAPALIVRTAITGKSAGSFSIAEYGADEPTNPLRSPKVARAISSEPIQVQALYAQGAGVPSVRPVAVSKTGVMDEIDYVYNYQMIGKVQCLTSYEYADNGSRLFNGEKWETLTMDMFNSLSGDVLCRMLTYDSPLLLTKNMKEFNIYNKYFIIRKNNIEEPERETARETVRRGVVSTMPKKSLGTKYFGTVTIKK